MGDDRDSRAGELIHPDVFITVAFAGIAVLVALVALLFLVPQIRREEAQVKAHETAR